MLPIFALCSGNNAANQLTEDVVVLAVVRPAVPLGLVKTVAEAVLFVQPGEGKLDALVQIFKQKVKDRALQIGWEPGGEGCDDFDSRV